MSDQEKLKELNDRLSSLNDKLIIVLNSVPDDYETLDDESFDFQLGLIESEIQEVTDQIEELISQM